MPAGDVLIHAGDITVQGELAELQAFFKWLEQQPFEHKIIIAGNHDFLFEHSPQRARALIPAGVHYLQDSQVTIAGFTIWGTPWTPMSPRWAFHADPGVSIARYWQLIPDKVDILVTHAPPAGTPLARLLSGRDVGCARLRERVLAVQPKVHIFGHIHEGYGTERWLVQPAAGSGKPPRHIQLVNAALLDHHYKLANEPIVIDLE